MPALEGEDPLLTAYLAKAVDNDAEYAQWFASDAGGNDVPAKVRLLSYFAYSPRFKAFALAKLRDGVYPGAQRYLVKLCVFHDLAVGAAADVLPDLTALALDPAVPIPARVRAAVLMGYGADDLIAVGPNLPTFARVQYADLESSELAAYWLDRIFQVRGAPSAWMDAEKGSVAGMLAESHAVLALLGLSTRQLPGEAALMDTLKGYQGADPKDHYWREQLDAFTGGAAGDETPDQAAEDLATAAANVATVPLSQVRRLKAWYGHMATDPAAARRLADRQLAEFPPQGGLFSPNRSLLGPLLRMASTRPDFSIWVRPYLRAPYPAELSAFLAEQYFCATAATRSAEDDKLVAVSNAVVEAVQNRRTALPAALRLLALAADKGRSEEALWANAVSPIGLDLRLVRNDAARCSFELAASPGLDRFDDLASSSGVLLHRDLAIWLALLPVGSEYQRAALSRLSRCEERGAGRDADLRKTLIGVANR